MDETLSSGEDSKTRTDHAVNEKRHETPTSRPSVNPVPCTDPWDPNYDYEFERSGIERTDITVLPPGRFSDEPMPEARRRRLRGSWYERARDAGPRNSPIVEGRFAQVCCGWREPPTAGELYEAVHAEAPTARQRAVFTTWLYESPEYELLEGWADGVYTIRELVRAMYRHGWETGPRSQYLNNFAQPPDTRQQ